MRTFFAIKPPDDTIQYLLETTAPLRRSIAEGVKWIAPDQIHLTLKFLGEFDPAHVETMKHKIQSLCNGSSPIRTATATIGVFPKKGFPRIIWYGLENPEKLNQLAKRVETICAEIGYPREKRPFSPHLTIGRVRRNASHEAMHAIQNTVSTFSIKRSHPFTISRLHFVHSTLTPYGPQYHDLFTIGL